MTLTLIGLFHDFITKSITYLDTQWLIYDLF